MLDEKMPASGVTHAPARCEPAAFQAWLIFVTKTITQRRKSLFAVLDQNLLSTYLKRFYPSLPGLESCSAAFVPAGRSGGSRRPIRTDLKRRRLRKSLTDANTVYRAGSHAAHLPFAVSLSNRAIAPRQRCGARRRSRHRPKGGSTQISRRPRFHGEPAAPSPRQFGFWKD